MDEMRLTPAFRERAARLLDERGLHPFEAARFFRLPAVAQVFGLMVLADDPARDALELIGELEEDTERIAAGYTPEEESRINEAEMWGPRGRPGS